MIPRTLHFIWLPSGPADVPGPFLNACRAQTVGMHPTWEVRDHADGRALAHDAFDPIRDDLDSAWQRFAGRPTSRSDLMRLAVLYLYGGVYCDHDVWAIRPFDCLLDRDVILAADRMDPLLIGEHVMGATPRNPKIWAILTRFIRSAPNPNGRYSPRLTRFILETGLTGTSWEVMAPPVFCPHGRIVESEDECYEVYKQTRAVHCWARLADGRDVEYSVDRLRELGELCRTT